MPESDLLRQHRARVQRVIAHLEAHLDEPLDVSTLSRVGGWSEFHFHRVFRALTGENAMAHVRRLRLERAARALRQGEPRILDVALSAGFDSHEAFTRAFHSHFGVAPSSYREAHRPPLDGPSPPGDFARLERREPTPIVALRHVGPYAGVGAAWARLFPLAMRAGVRPGEWFGLCWDDPEIGDPSTFRYDACMATPAPIDAPGVTRRVLEGGAFVVAVHHGPYERISETYSRIFRWALERDVALGTDPTREHYRVGPPAPDPGRYVTEIAWRIA